MKWGVIIWFSTILFGFICSTIFISSWINQWIRRPFAVEESTVIKQSIPFPSVTICMEGSTLWPTVQAVLEQHQVSAQELPKVSAGFIRLKLNETEYEARKEFIDRGRKKLSDFCKDDFRIFKFLFFITTMMDRKIEKGTLYNDTAALANELAQETYSEEESESYYETRNNVRHEVFYYKYLKANFCN